MERNKNEIHLKLNEEVSAQPSIFRKNVWQVVPSVCATLMCLPYGVMLGWPSPTYPSLIEPDSPVWISMDQSAMVAGFLMIGNTLGTPFSSSRRLGAKYGIIAGVTLMTIGWMMMWQAKDIYWLLGSRLFVGVGHGFSVGQLKFYIAEMCQDSLAKKLFKHISLYTISGVILAFAYGPFVSFRHFSIIATIISILVLFLSIFLPSTPRELVKSSKTNDAKKLIKFISPHVDVVNEMVKIKERVHNVDRDLSFCDIIKNSSLRKNFIILAFAVFFQQFSGAPATLVYTQMIFIVSGCPRPDLCAIVYIFTFFLANAYGIFCVPNYNKKTVLLLSSIGTSLLIIIKIIVLVEKINETSWNFTSLVVMLLFIVVHTVGLGSVPPTLVPDLFPKEARRVVIHFVIMAHSMFALTITKIFQVMFHQIGLFAPFCLFLVISTFSIIFVIIFVPSNRKSTENT